MHFSFHSSAEHRLVFFSQGTPEASGGEPEPPERGPKPRRVLKAGEVPEPEEGPMPRIKPEEKKPGEMAKEEGKERTDSAQGFMNRFERLWDRTEQMMKSGGGITMAQEELKDAEARRAAAYGKAEKLMAEAEEKRLQTRIRATDELNKRREFYMKEIEKTDKPEQKAELQRIYDELAKDIAALQKEWRKSPAQRAEEIAEANKKAFEVMLEDIDRTARITENDEQLQTTFEGMEGLPPISSSVLGLNENERQFAENELREAVLSQVGRLSPAEREGIKVVKEKGGQALMSIPKSVIQRAGAQSPLAKFTSSSGFRERNGSLEARVKGDYFFFISWFANMRLEMEKRNERMVK